MDERELNPEVRCLAAPIRNNQGVVVASIGITAPAVSFTKSAIPAVAELVKEAARNIYKDAYQQRLSEST